MPALVIGKTTNCQLSFSKAGVNYDLKTRARGVSHGFDVVASESAARQYRAFYPHQRAVSPFTLTFELMGYTELKAVMDFLRQFLTAVVQTGSTIMVVRVPSRNFLRFGLPTGGVMDTDQTASNVFLPTVVFDSLTDPLSVINPPSAEVDLGSTTADDASKFFYPASPAVNDPNARSDSFYDSAPVPMPDNGPPPLPLPNVSGPDEVPGMFFPGGS